MDFKIIPDSLDNALKNLTDKPTAAIGQSISDLWYLVFGGISASAEKKRLKLSNDIELFKEQLEEKIDQIPADQQKDPDIQIAAQALEASKYCVSSEQLREMFSNLIAGTMNKTMDPYIHPSFPEFLKQCSETDASLIKRLKDHNSLPVADILLTKEKTMQSFNKFASDVFLPFGNLSCEAVSISGAFLQKSGIINILESQRFEQMDAYSPFENLPVYKEAKKAADTNEKLLILKPKMCSLTIFGRALIHVCVD